GRSTGPGKVGHRFAMIDPTGAAVPSPRPCPGSLPGIAKQCPPRESPAGNGAQALEKLTLNGDHQLFRLFQGIEAADVVFVVARFAATKVVNQGAALRVDRRPVSVHDLAVLLLNRTQRLDDTDPQARFFQGLPQRRRLRLLALIDE